MKNYTEAWIEIDLNAVRHNVKKLVDCAAPAEVMAVIKADACGHGAKTLAPLIVKAGAGRLGVAKVSEAVELRRAGITDPVHVLGYIHPSAAGEIAALDLVVDPRTGEAADRLSKAAIGRDRQVSLHVEVDTGLCRWGTPGKEIAKYIAMLKDRPGLRVDGIFTHFTSLDNGDYPGTESAFREFMHIADRAEQLLGKRLTRHVCNTVGTLSLPHMHLDMVRPGIGLYGLLALPLETPFTLEPALSLKSRIGLIREMEAGASIGYGAVHRLMHKTRVAIVPLGFGDGLPPQVGTKGEALVKGTRVSLIGKISTDAVMLNVEKCPQCRPGDEVVFIGSSGNERIKAEDLAGRLDIFVDPIIINLGRGLPREYLDNR